MKKGIKHLIQCHCMLPQYKNAKDPVFHKFPVFSVIDESDTVVLKYAECNNCGAAHKVYDICKSEILTGRDEVSSRLNKEDFKYSLPKDLYELLNQYDRDLSDFEQSQFIIDNKVWNSTLVLSREEMDDHIQGKVLRFIAADKFRIESYLHRDTLS
tara:strand:+ start:275 stop:742 length:468 start_codon:yes stop_codon:yes gene_type:complete